MGLDACAQKPVVTVAAEIRNCRTGALVKSPVAGQIGLAASKPLMHRSLYLAFAAYDIPYSQLGQLPPETLCRYEAPTDEVLLLPQEQSVSGDYQGAEPDGLHALKDAVNVEACAVVCIISYDCVVAPPLPRNHRDRPGYFIASRRVEVQGPIIANVYEALIVVTIFGPAEDSSGPVRINPEFDSQVSLAVQNGCRQADAVICPVERQAGAGSDAHNRGCGEIDLDGGHKVIGVPILILVQRPAGQVAQGGRFAAAGD